MRNLVSVWLVGEGALAERRARAWQTLDNLVALRRFAAPEAVSAALATERPPQAADVCVPLRARPALATALAEAGAHLLVEPPVAERLSQAVALCAVASSLGRLVVPAHTTLYTPGLVRLLSLVHSRRLGPVQNVFSYRYGASREPLLHATHEDLSGSDLYVHAALIKALCLLPEARVSNVSLARRTDGLSFAATMYYDDDILATVRCSPELTPARIGLMVTFVEAVLQWEVTRNEEHLVMSRGPERRPLALAAGDPTTAMVHRFLRSARDPVPPYEQSEAALRSLALMAAWAEALNLV